VIASDSFRFEPFIFSEEIEDASSFDFPDYIVLGKQAEACFEYFLKKSKRYKLLAANVQVQGKKETLGELDYIVFDTEINKTLHVELAGKFYLFDENLTGCREAKWIGPNRKDTLEFKLNKLKEKQFPVLNAKETAIKLKSLGIDVISEIEQQLCLKASLFLPKGFKKENVPQNYLGCIEGHWINFNEFSFEDKEATYALPNKKQWLLPFNKITEWRSFKETQQILNMQIAEKTSPLIYKKKGSGIEKFFVTWWQ